ncbi:MAG: hypothetical protein WBB98_07140 [Xanthobacteraceae bacterium]
MARFQTSRHDMVHRYRRRWTLIITILGGLIGSAPVIALAQQPTTVERNAKGQTAKNIQVGLYINVKPDCSSGPLPTIRLVTPPANGTLTIRRGKVNATNYKQCLALEVPGFIAFYKSKADFIGTDVTTIEVKYPQGRVEIQRITVIVGAGAEQKI